MKIGSTPIAKKLSKFSTDFKFMKKAGFTAIDNRDFIWPKNKAYKLSEAKFNKYFNNLKIKLLKYNLECYQMHGMWCTDLFDLDKNENWATLINYYEKSMKACAILGCKYLVIHPRLPFGWQMKPEQDEFCYKNNLEFVKRLLPYAIKYDVTICLENMPCNFPYTSIDGIIRCIDEINDEHVQMCLDTGHYNVVDYSLDIYSTILKINQRLKVLHLHDNHNDGDYHLLPGQGTLDWAMLFKGLKEIGFLSELKSLQTIRFPSLYISVVYLYFAIT